MIKMYNYHKGVNSIGNIGMNRGEVYKKEPPLVSNGTKKKRCYLGGLLIILYYII